MYILYIVYLYTYGTIIQDHVQKKNNIYKMCFKEFYLMFLLLKLFKKIILIA